VHGAQAPAYGSIVAAGANACVLHYRADRGLVRDGELVLIDAACELDGYASDITRTFPANGRFTGPARRGRRACCPRAPRRRGVSQPVSIGGAALLGAGRWAAWARGCCAAARLWRRVAVHA
jgi:hypothetical protein